MTTVPWGATRTGGWVVAEDAAVQSVLALDGADVRDVDNEVTQALWRRGLARTDACDPFVESVFQADLSSSREYYTLVYLLASGCNLACSYCYLGHAVPTTTGMLHEEAARARFEEALALDYPGVLVDFGEIAVAGPLVRRLLPAFRTRARELGKDVWFAIQTNGATLDARLCAEIAGDDLLLSVSLDGPQPVHDQARRTHGGSGTYAAAVSALTAARGAGIRTNIISTIARHNVDIPAAVLDEVLAQQPDRFLLKPVLPQGEAREAWDALSITTLEYSQFVTEALEAGMRRGLQAFDQTTQKFFHRLIGSPLGWRDACTSRWCGSGRDLHVVDSANQLHACPRYVDSGPPPTAAFSPPLLQITIKSSSSPQQLVASRALSDDLLSSALRRPHVSCEGCSWYRTCGGGCTLAGGLQAQDPHCDSHITTFEFLVNRTLPRLLDPEQSFLRHRMGVVVRRVTQRQPVRQSV